MAEPWRIGLAAIARYRRHPQAWCKAKGHKAYTSVKRKRARVRCRRCGRVVWAYSVHNLTLSLRRSYSPQWWAAFNETASPLLDQ